MNLYKIKQLPPIRVLVCGIRILRHYFLTRGHISSRQGMSADRQGAHRPWFSYAAIDFMENLDLSACDVFEFGAGASTLWWLERAKSVTSVELDSDWHKKITEHVPAGTLIINQPDIQLYPAEITTVSKDFDLVVVDGAERYECARAAIKKLKPDGIIILDNCDWYPNTAKMLRDQGFIQLDFYGFPPNNSYTEMTSLFTRSLDMIRNRKDVSHPVPGGYILQGGAHDDGPRS